MNDEGNLFRVQESRASFLIPLTHPLLFNIAVLMRTVRRPSFLEHDKADKAKVKGGLSAPAAKTPLCEGGDAFASVLGRG